MKHEKLEQTCSSEFERERARAAKVTMSYRVWRDPFAGFDRYRTTLYLEKACDLLREGKRSSMQVLYRWRIGDKEGDGYVSYVREAHPTATNQFIERTIRSLIERAIAEDLAAGRYLIADRGDRGIRKAAAGA